MVKLYDSNEAKDKCKALAVMLLIIVDKDIHWAFCLGLDNPFEITEVRLAVWTIEGILSSSKDHLETRTDESMEEGASNSAKDNEVPKARVKLWKICVLHWEIVSIFLGLHDI